MVKLMFYFSKQTHLITKFQLVIPFYYIGKQVSCDHGIDICHQTSGVQFYINFSLIFTLVIIIFTELLLMHKSLFSQSQLYIYIFTVKNTLCNILTLSVPFE